MLGVDRLDMVKGIPQKLLAYEKFLEEHPEWRDKVWKFGGGCVWVCMCVCGGERGGEDRPDPPPFP